MLSKLHAEPGDTAITSDGMVKVVVVKFHTKLLQYQRIFAASSTKGPAPIAKMICAPIEPTVSPNGTDQIRTSSPEGHESSQDALDIATEVADSECEAPLTKRVLIREKNISGLVRTQHEENEVRYMGRRRSSRIRVVSETPAKCTADHVSDNVSTGNKVSARSDISLSNRNADEEEDGHEDHTSIHNDNTRGRTTTYGASRKKAVSQRSVTSLGSSEPAKNRRRMSRLRSVDLGLNCARKTIPTTNHGPPQSENQRQPSIVTISSEATNQEQSYPSLGGGGGG